VLIGTDSAADSAVLSAWLTDIGLAHALLSAASHPDDAATAADAGIAGRITIVTQGAGHGTPIHPDAAALRAGGLHVINCQLNPSRRLDRQLLGRAGRDGEPGQVQTWISLEAKPLCANIGTRLLTSLLRSFALRRVAGIVAPDGEVRLQSFVLRTALRLLQRAHERRDARARLRLLREN
jgi:preprotein translocase subunit SecA